MTEQYEKMNRKELYEAAKAKGYKGISRYKKAQLLELLLGGDTVRQKDLPAKDAKKRVKIEGSSGMSSIAGRIVESETKQAAKAETQSGEIYVDWGEPLPESYNVDRISAAAKDPNWLFVNWELTGPRRGEVAKSHGSHVLETARWHLRLVGLDSGENVDLPINVESRSWYVPVSPDGIYKVKIGLLTGEGEFIEFAITREVRTPRSGPSDIISDEWTVADEQFQKFLKQAGAPGSSRSSWSG